ncbi:His/Gly/Thr/Pro-type tRNA ligase C-terminal domain-containing protein [Desulfuribacillus alkaliarsenatis]
MKKLFQAADRDNCKFAFIIGDEELHNKKIKLRDLVQGTEILMDLK